MLAAMMVPQSEMCNSFGIVFFLHSRTNFYDQVRITIDCSHKLKFLLCTYNGLIKLKDTL